MNTQPPRAPVGHDLDEIIQFTNYIIQIDIRLEWTMRSRNRATKFVHQLLYNDHRRLPQRVLANFTITNGQLVEV